jgi:hypothetical protein
LVVVVVVEMAAVAVVVVAAAAVAVMMVVLVVGRRRGASSAKRRQPDEMPRCPDAMQWAGHQIAGRRSAVGRRCRQALSNEGENPRAGLINDSLRGDAGTRYVDRKKET